MRPNNRSCSRRRCPRSHPAAPTESCKRALGKVRAAHGTGWIGLGVTSPASGAFAVKGVLAVLAQDQRDLVIRRKVVIAYRALLIVVAERFQNHFENIARIPLIRLHVFSTQLGTMGRRARVTDAF